MTDPEVEKTEVHSGIKVPRISIALFCLAFLMVLFTAWVPTFAHINDVDWTDHQKLHVFREVFMATVFGLAGIVLCLGPLRSGAKMILHLVGLLCFGVVAGFWFGLPITGIGKSGVEPFINHGIQLAAMMLAYLMALVSMYKRSRS
ncbi:MAG: hypothetical protein Pars2KO_11200 [Parasphingorhabdus sp.]